jgi:hypothetical protein
VLPCPSSNPAFHPPPSGPNWVHETKHDGYRLMALIAGVEDFQVAQVTYRAAVERLPEVVAFAACVGGTPPTATITATCSRTKSAASAGNRST